MHTRACVGGAGRLARSRRPLNQASQAVPGLLRPRPRKKTQMRGSQWGRLMCRLKEKYDETKKRKHAAEAVAHFDGLSLLCRLCMLVAVASARQSTPMDLDGWTAPSPLGTLGCGFPRRRFSRRPLAPSRR